MWQDPYTLTVALSKSGSAEGELYTDDGDSFAFEKGEFIWRGFEFDSGVLRSRDLVRARPGKSGLKDEGGYNAEGNAWAEKIGHVRVEKVVLLGLEKKPRSVSVKGGKSVEFEWVEGGIATAGRKKEGRASELVLKDPGVLIARDWEIVIE
jgi:alpha 1,3-glucosidase